MTRKSVIADVLDSRPDAGRVLREVFQLPCDDCVVSERETIEEGARYYKLDPDAMVAKLNACPPREEKKITPPAPPP